jgi:glycine reductase complex component B subunit gamma
LEKAGFLTVLISNLCSVAEVEGPNRMLRTPGRFHHPLGDPALSPEEERRWRLGLTRAALATLQQAVAGPTVFEPDDLGPSEATAS